MRPRDALSFCKCERGKYSQESQDCGRVTSCFFLNKKKGNKLTVFCTFVPACPPSLSSPPPSPPSSCLHTLQPGWLPSPFSLLALILGSGSRQPHPLRYRLACTQCPSSSFTGTMLPPATHLAFPLQLSLHPFCPSHCVLSFSSSFGHFARSFSHQPLLLSLGHSE